MDINVHELLKRQVFSEEITPHSRNSSNSSGKNRANEYMFFEQNRPYSSQTFGISDNYLILDSFTKAGSSNLSRGELNWNIQMQGATNIEQGIIGSRNLLDNIIEIELSSFTLPILKEINYPKLDLDLGSNVVLEQNNNIPSTAAKLNPVLQIQQIPIEAPPRLPTTVPPNVIPWTSNPLSQTPFAGLITIQIREAGVQAYNGGHTSALHHFVFQIQYRSALANIAPNVTSVVPLYDSSNKFIFTEPILQFNSISLVFRNPDFPISFEPDIINCKIYCNFTLLSAANKYFLSIMYENHNLLTEDRIYIKNFNSGIYQLDNYINSQNGLLVGYPPDSNGDSEDKDTGVVIDDDIFYLDPFITFNENFRKGTLNQIKGTYINNNTLQINATINYQFGKCLISNNITLNATANVNDTFNIGIFSGVYSYTVSNDGTAPNSVEIGNNLYITNISVLVNYMQSYNDIYIAKRRIIMPMRLRGVVNKVTNYKNA